MEKVLIELYVPATEQTFDILIPRASFLHQVLPLLTTGVHDLSRGTFLPNRETSLCDMNGSILNINMTVEELGIINGSRLMLI